MDHEKSDSFVIVLTQPYWIRNKIWIVAYIAFCVSKHSILRLNVNVNRPAIFLTVAKSETSGIASWIYMLDSPGKKKQNYNALVIVFSIS